MHKLYFNYLTGSYCGEKSPQDVIKHGFAHGMSNESLLEIPINEKISNFIDEHQMIWREGEVKQHSFTLNFMSDKEVTEYEKLKADYIRISEAKSILANLLLIFDGKQIRPAKNTSRQDVYNTVLKLQFLFGIPRVYPKEWEKGASADGE